jgi:malate synthase
MSPTPVSEGRSLESLTAEGIEIKGPITHGYSDILTAEALRFVAKLARSFEARRQELLQRRMNRQRKWDDGELPDFLPETREVREGQWTVASIPADMLDRRIEITGPVDRKMVINALNSRANVFMADFEDANSPTWANNVEGQINLRDAVRREIAYTSPEGKEYELADSIATLLVRPRGWHLVEKHVLVDGKPVSGSLFDFGLFFFHNAAQQIERGTGPYFYLPKLESYLEARLWNDVFNVAQDELGIPRGTIRATVLIETLSAAFEMDEILYELREHSSGLNCGRWDYIFSYIKKFRSWPDHVLPDRGLVSMDRHFLNAYVELLIKTCHRRAAHAMGGMAAQIPIKNDPAANEQALDKVRQDKRREVDAGHDGTWVAHPGLVPLAKEIFDSRMHGLNQLDRLRDDVHITPADLVAVPGGDITERGLRHNVDVGVQYLESWLRGVGCVPIYNLMEDAATSEISRSQVWQWVRHEASLNDGRTVTPQLVRQTTAEELEKLRQVLGAERFDAGRFDLASRIFEDITTRTQFTEFMTLVAYDHID